jgi:hypothetical protein
MANQPGHEHLHASYASLYSDERHDVWNGDYGGYFRQFRANLQAQGNGKTELNEITWNRGDNTPHAYAAFFYAPAEEGVPPEPRVYCIHHPMRAAPPMGIDGPVTKMIFMGDVHDGMFPPVILWQDDPENHFFRATPNVRLPTPATIDAALANDPDLTHFGPYPNNNEEAGTETARIRRICFLPPPLASLLLTYESMSAKEFWNIIVGHIRQQGDEAIEVHRSVIEYGQALLTLCIEPNNQPNTPVLIDNHRCVPYMEDPVIPILDRRDRIFVKEKIERDLPGLAPTKQGGNPEPTVEAINRLTEEVTQTQARAEERSLEEAAKTPTKYWGDMTGIINRITHTATVNELPPLYHKIAASNKRTERAVIQEVFFTLAAEHRSTLSFPVTPQLCKTITGLQFIRFDPNDLSRGIHPFWTVPIVGADRTQVDRQLDAYDDVLQGSTGLQLAESQQIQDRTSVVMPKTLLQAQTTLKDFRILLAALLGREHRHTRAYNDFVREFSEIITSHLEPLMLSAGPEAGSRIPTKLVLWVANRSAAWFHSQYQSTFQLEPPNYMELIQKISVKDDWEPYIPARYLPRQQPAARPPTGAPAGANPSGSGGAAAGGSRDRVTNPSVDPVFANRTSDGVSIGDARRRGEEIGRPIPKTSNGTEVCLSYHILGFCWSTCNRKSTHRTLSAPEKSALKTWCDQCFTSS